MAFNFEKFTDTKKNFVPKVTIRKGGHLGISQASAERFGINGDGYYGVFFFDRQARVVGFKLTRDEREEGAVKIQYRTQGSNVVIQASIKSFLDCYRIDYVETNSYRPELDEESGLIVFDLNKPIIPMSRKKKAQENELVIEVSEPAEGEEQYFPGEKEPF